jgi:hypothetical protein
LQEQVLVQAKIIDNNDIMITALVSELAIQTKLIEQLKEENRKRIEVIEFLTREIKDYELYFEQHNLPLPRGAY